MAHDQKQPAVILVVDDEELLRMHATGVLEDAGYRVVEASDAAAALNVLEREPDIRLLFTDVNMPGKYDGLALAETVHQRWPHVLLLVTSANCKLADGDLPDHGRFLAKPYGAKDVVGRVSGLIEDGHARDGTDGSS